MRKLFWFVVESWGYLGCNSGWDRWRARARYATGIIPATIRFAWLSRND